jgi:RNA polymerase sigma factor (sigma-70 family)
MATAPPGTLLRHIHQLAAGRLPARTDRQLLEDFAARGDEAAFAALVERHGPMVLRVCRRVLRHEQDAEDAFQATFLVLARNTASIRRRDTVGGWLHGVAYRTALKARRSAARRRDHEARLRTIVPRVAAGPTWDEVQAVLDEEVQRLPPLLRQAFVQCVLEGKGGVEAATELGCREGAVKTRVYRARRSLQRQLARRGIQLAALLAALSAAEGAGRASPSAALSRSAVGIGLLAAAGEPAAGVIPAHVAALAAGVTRAMFVTRARIATAVLLAVGLVVAGAGTLLHQLPAAEQPPAGNQSSEVGKRKPEEKADRVEVTGRVLNPDGKPFAGARLYLRHRGATGPDYPAQATSDADGRFTFAFKRSVLDESSPYTGWFQVIAVADGYGPDWTYQEKPTPRADLTLRLVEDRPIQGRVIDLNGKPIRGGTLRVESIEAYVDTEAFLQTVRDRKWPLVQNKGWGGPFPGQPHTLTTDSDGRVRLSGVGRERVVQFQLRGPGIQYGPVRALTRELKAPVEPRPLQYPEGGPNIATVYGATFVFAAAPSRPLRGVVRDKSTGKPVAGVQISAFGTTDSTRSDRDGRYELWGVGKNTGGYSVSFDPAGQLYFSRSVLFPDSPGLGAIDGDLEMVGGILARGRVTHRVTGKPIAGARVHYNPLLPNPFVRRFGPNGAGTSPCSWTETGPDGSYHLVVLPGPGVLGFAAYTPGETFMPALVTARDLKDFFKDNVNRGNEDLLRIQAGVNSMTAIGQEGFNQLLLINPGETDETLTRDVALQPARPLRGKVVGPDGQGVAGVRAYKLAPGILSQPLAGDTFTVEGLNPRRPRHLLFFDKERKHGAFVTIKGEVREPLTVRLEPCGSAAGRLVDEDGQPAAGVVVRLDTEDIHDTGPETVKTDAAGRFQFAGLVPGQPYQARRGPGPFGQYLFSPFAVKPGQSRELGVCRLKLKQ